MTAYYSKSARGYAEAYRDCWRWAMKTIPPVRWIWGGMFLPGSDARNTIEALRRDGAAA